MKNFYFTIIDDTDDATLENIKPVYDFLYEKKIFLRRFGFTPQEISTLKEIAYKGQSI